MVGTILFVDDEPDLRMMATAYFEMVGYKVLAAENEGEALQLSQGTELCAAILDVNLPGNGSGQLLADLKQSRPQTPIILYTGREEGDEVVKAMLKQGATRYLFKDGSLEKLLQAVKDVCGS